MKIRGILLVSLGAGIACFSGCASITVPTKPDIPQPLPAAIKSLKLRVGSVAQNGAGDLVGPLRGALETALLDAGLGVTTDPSEADGLLTSDVEEPSWLIRPYKTTILLRGHDGAQIDTIFFEGGSLGDNFQRSGGNFQRIAEGIAYNLVAKLIGSPKFVAFAQERSQHRPVSLAAGTGSLDRATMKQLMAESLRDASGGAKPAATARQITSDVDKPKFLIPENPNNFALVIGVEKYSNELPDAQFAERDAEAVRDTLVAMGYPERNVKFLKGNRAVRSSLESYLEDWLPKNVKDGATVFVYFSGHGAPDPETGQAYLVPWDGDPSFLSRTGYPLKRLYSSLNALKAKRVVVALDSCFSGAGGRSVLPRGTRPLVGKVDLGKSDSMGKLVVFTASAANQISGTLEAQGHGLFTYYFLRGLNGPAAAADGSVSARTLYDYLSPKVEDEASRANRGQSPQLLVGDDAGTIRLR